MKVTTKHEATARLLSDESESAQKFKKAIEDSIARWDGRAITVSTEGIPSRIVDKVLDDYREVGWETSRVSDQRDGDYAVLQ